MSSTEDGRTAIRQDLQEMEKVLALIQHSVSSGELDDDARHGATLLLEGVRGRLKAASISVANIKWTGRD